MAKAERITKKIVEKLSIIKMKDAKNLIKLIEANGNEECAK